MVGGGAHVCSRQVYEKGRGVKTCLGVGLVMCAAVQFQADSGPEVSGEYSESRPLEPYWLGVLRRRWLQ